MGSSLQVPIPDKARVYCVALAGVGRGRSDWAIRGFREKMGPQTSTTPLMVRRRGGRSARYVQLRHHQKVESSHSLGRGEREEGIGGFLGVKSRLDS